MARNTIMVAVVLEEHEPTGSPCSLCQDACYLTEHRLRWETMSGRPISCENAMRFCGSCVEIATERLRALPTVLRLDDGD